MYCTIYYCGTLGGIAVDNNKSLRISISTVIRDVLRNWWRVLLVSMAFSLFTYIFLAEKYTKTYTVKATYIVSVKDAFSSSQNLSAAVDTAAQFTQIINSSVMKSMVMDDLEIDYFDGTVRASAIEETNLLNLSVTSSTPKMAFSILSSIMKNYKSITQYVVGDYIMEVLQSATIPQGPDVIFNPMPMMTKVFLGCIALLCVFVACISYFKDTIRSRDDVESKLDAKLLGMVNHEKKYKSIISKLKKNRSNMLINNPTSSFLYTENIRKAENKIKNRMDRHNSKILLVTSLMENEGKSTVASNIALAMAEESDKVLLVDCDFRKPALYKIFDKEADKVYNLGDVLTGNGEKGDLIERAPGSDLFVAFNTIVYQNSTELIANGKLAELFDYLKEKMDYIVIDASPMGLVADAEEIANFADASILVVKQHFMEAKYINDKIAALNECKAKFLGCILNDVYDSSISILSGGKSYYDYDKDYVEE